MANQMTVEIENLKCGGCENTIVKGLMSITGVAGVIVDHAQKAVVLEADANLRPQ
ncbi:MAG: Heavy-metal-associated domain, partial [Pseudomonadota bacterium]